MLHLFSLRCGHLQAQTLAFLLYRLFKDADMRANSCIILLQRLSVNVKPLQIDSVSVFGHCSYDGDAVDYSASFRTSFDSTTLPARFDLLVLTSS